MKLDLTFALIIALVIFILIFILCRYVHIRTWSALALSLLISIIILFILYPLTNIDLIMNSTLPNFLYLMFVLLTGTVIVLYILDKAIHDRDSTGTNNIAAEIIHQAEAITK